MVSNGFSCCQIHLVLVECMQLSVLLSAVFDEIGLLVFVHGAMYVAFAGLEQSQSIRAVGLHQTVGDCNATSTIYTPLGQVSACLRRTVDRTLHTVRTARS